MLSRRLVLAGSALAGLSRTAAAQNRWEDAENEVVLLSADAQANSVQTIEGIAARLGQGGRMRVESGRSVLESAARLTERPTAVAAAMPAVTLAFMTQSRLPETVVYALRFIGRLGVSEIHVLASRRMGGLQDLVGQIVAVGPRGSATQATASIFLQRASVRVNPLYLEHEEALTAVLRGQIPAMILVAIKPAQLFFNLNLSDGVHFLPTGDRGAFPLGLFPTQILQSDYPLLSGGEAGLGRPVQTLGVPLVLACFSWAAATPMAMGLARLADRLIQRGSGLRGFDMAADVPGWQRYSPVLDWLARGRAGTVQDVVLAQRRGGAPAASRDRLREAAPQSEPDTAPGEGGLTAEQKERLFQQFLNWRRSE
jgi:uncharacterized protein